MIHKLIHWFKVDELFSEWTLWIIESIHLQKLNFIIAFIFVIKHVLCIYVIFI